MRWLGTALVLGTAWLALAAGPAAPSSSPPAQNRAASWLALRPVTVRCLTEREAARDEVITDENALAYVEGRWDGKRFWPGDVATFAPRMCAPLVALVRGYPHSYPLEELALALLVLTLEAGHLRGHAWAGHEGRVQCWALRHVGYAARRLGVAAQTVPHVVALALEWDARLPENYRWPDCRRPKPSR